MMNEVLRLSFFLRELLRLAKDAKLDRSLKKPHLSFVDRT
jgi:hypothetical protein